MASRRPDRDFRNYRCPFSRLGRHSQNPSDLAQAVLHPYGPKPPNVLGVKSDSIVMHAEHQAVNFLFQFDMDCFGLRVAHYVLQRFLRDPIETDA